MGAVKIFQNTIKIVTLCAWISPSFC